MNLFALPTGRPVRIRMPGLILVAPDGARLAIDGPAILRVIPTRHFSRMPSGALRRKFVLYDGRLNLNPMQFWMSPGVVSENGREL